MTPPFPWSLPPHRARRQAAGLLTLFYGLIYGSTAVLGIALHRAVSPILGTLVLGVLMLLAVGIFIRRDVSWWGSLGLGRQPIKSVLGWGLLGLGATYAVNLLLTAAYLFSQGNVEAQMAGRMRWLEYFAEIPAAAILPLTAFVAFWEETVFRGFLLGRLRAALPGGDTRWARLRRDLLAVLLCGLCFGAGHGYQGVLGLMQTTTAGIVLGALTVWRGSLWPAIGAHLAIDTFGLLVIRAAVRSLGGAAGGAG